jgi:hypothetical protein
MSDLDDEDLALVGKLRALPPEGVEPDWHKLEAAIRAEVGERAPRPWWRNWRWIVPIWALATTAAVALLVTRDKTVEKTAPRSTPMMSKHVETPAPSATPATADEASAMWLAGEIVELDDVDDTRFEPLDDSAHAALDIDEPDDSFDLHWIDQLDERAMDSVEQWLMHERS